MKAKIGQFNNGKYGIRIVQFNNGKYGIRKWSLLGSGLFGGHVFLSKREDDDHWWSTAIMEDIAKYAQFETLDGAKERLKLWEDKEAIANLKDYGKVVV